MCGGLHLLDEDSEGWSQGGYLLSAYSQKRQRTATDSEVDHCLDL